MNNPFVFKRMTAQKLKKRSWKQGGLWKLNCMKLSIIFTIDLVMLAH